MAIAVKPPASYSMPSFGSGDYGNIDSQLDALSQMGFRWVTFTPTYAVTEKVTTVTFSTGIPLIGKWLDRLLGSRTVRFLFLNENQSPISELKNAVMAAVTKGFSVKIEPHLDYIETLNSTSEARWRMEMYFDPSDRRTLMNGYYERVLVPIMDVIRDAAALTPPNLDMPPCFALTLGSEVDVSLFAFASGWEQVKSWMKQRRSDLGLDLPHRLSFGHKLNYDVFMPGGAARRKMKPVRERWGESEATPGDLDRMELTALAYLRDLDYVSFSFYPPVSRFIPNANQFDWTKEDDPQAIDAVANAFKAFAQTLRTKLGNNVPLDIGEFGLGGADVDAPFEDNPQDFIERDPQSGEWRKKADMEKKRRLFIKGMARFMARNKGMFQPGKDSTCGGFLPATFWTVKQYDFLGIWDYPVIVTLNEEEPQTFEVPHSLFVDEELIEYIQACNQRTYEQ